MEYLFISFPKPHVMRLDVGGARPEEVRVVAEAVADAYLEDASVRRKTSGEQKEIARAFAKGIAKVIIRATGHGKANAGAKLTEQEKPAQVQTKVDNPTGPALEGTHPETQVDVKEEAEARYPRCAMR